MLGITIDEGSNEGVFVSSVSKDSLASQVGLQVGDQILEVYGVNVRSCGKENAARVMSNRSNTLDMKVQFNPEYLHQGHHGSGQYHRIGKEEEEDSEESGMCAGLVSTIFFPSTAAPCSSSFFFFLR